MDRLGARRSERGGVGEVTLVFYVVISILALLPAVIIPRSEWDVKLWFFAGGLIWLLFMAAPVAELIRYLWG